MRPDQVPYLIPYFLSFVVSLGISWYAWRRRQFSGALSYTWVAFSQALTTLAYVFEISSDVLQTKVFWDDVQWFTLSVTGISLIVFALHFAERPPARPFRFFVLLSIGPLLFIGLVITSRWHGLIRQNTHLAPGDPFSALKYDFTLASYTMGALLLSAGFATMGVLIWRAFRVRGVYRSQLVTVLIGVSLPTIGGLLALTGVELSAQRDVSPITFAIGDLVVAWGLFRYRLFDVAPIAREVVMDHMPDSVIVLDNHGRIIDLNPAARSLLKPLSGDKPLIGRHVREVFSRWTDLVETYTGVREHVEHEITITTLEGLEQTFVLSVSPISVRKTYIGGQVVVLRNITDRKKMEGRLREALDKAEQADRIKSQLLASVSHELRTPLNAILNFTQFVQSGLKGPINEEQADSLEKVMSSSRHLNALINDLLDISKIEAKALELDLQDNLDLEAELREIYTIAQGLLADKPVEAALILDQPLPRLRCDPRRVHQILLNLVSNACKFTEQGKVTIAASPGDQELVVSIRDSGPGIKAEDQEGIFEVFQQGAEGLRLGNQGSGLGLPIARGLAQQHGGRLWVESLPGEGAAFFVALPLQGP